MDSEMRLFKSHGICELVPHVLGIRTLRIGWVTHRNFKNDVFEKNMARVVTRSNHQESVIDYNKSFSPVMGLEYPRLLAIAAISDLDVIRFDVTLACLHSTFKEEIYMGQPDLYADPKKSNWVRGTSLRVGEDWEDIERGTEFSHGE